MSTPHAQWAFIICLYRIFQNQPELPQMALSVPPRSSEVPRRFLARGDPLAGLWIVDGIVECDGELSGQLRLPQIGLEPPCSEGPRCFEAGGDHLGRRCSLGPLHGH